MASFPPNNPFPALQAVQHHQQLPPHRFTGFELEEALFSTAPVGLHCVDARGVILWANQKELNLLGFTNDQYVGQVVESFVYSDKVGGVVSAGESTASASSSNDQSTTINQLNPSDANASSTEVNILTADDKTLYKEVLKQITGGNPIQDIPIRFVTRSGTIVHLLLDCDGNGILRPGATSFESRYFRCFTRDDTARRIQEMRSNVLFQETNRSLQMLDNFMNRSMSQMRLPLTLMERACDLVTENIEDIDEVIRRNSSTMVAANVAAAASLSSVAGAVVGVVRKNNTPPPPRFENATNFNYSAPLTVALAATTEARSVVGLASTLVDDALALVDDITDLCRFDQGQVLVIDKEAVKVRDICMEALMRVPIPLGSGGMVEVVLDIQEGTPGRAMTDRSVLQRSLALLLNFAVDAAANAASKASTHNNQSLGRVILSVSDAAQYQQQGSSSSAKVSVFYTNPPDESESADPTTSADVYGNSLDSGIRRGGGFGTLPSIFKECYTKPNEDEAVGLDDQHNRAGRGGSMTRRIRLRESIEAGMTTCRRDKLGLGLSLLYHLVSAQGSDLRYEIVSEERITTSSASTGRVALPSMTKFWFLLPMSFDFPERLSAERMVKNDAQMQPQQDPFALTNPRQHLDSFFAVAQDDMIQQPARKKARATGSVTAHPADNSMQLLGATLMGAFKNSALFNPEAATIPVASTAASQAAALSDSQAVGSDSAIAKRYPGVAPGARPLVLVVEDTDVSASLLCMHLRKLNCTSHRAENGEVAMEMLRSAPHPGMYSLILMDLRMPVMDGFEATTIIKGSNASNIPVVALTGETSDEHRRKCEEIGFDDYKTKPLKRPQLKELLKKF
eukprot:scaffold190_cov185-Alexandrium_tamarense.AAC.2